MPKKPSESTGPTNPLPHISNSTQFCVDWFHWFGNLHSWSWLVLASSLLHPTERTVELLGVRRFQGSWKRSASRPSLFRLQPEGGGPPPPSRASPGDRCRPSGAGGPGASRLIEDAPERRLKPERAPRQRGQKQVGGGGQKKVERRS